MCENCYNEGGKPTIINEKTKAVAELISQVYDCDGCGVGGYGHIVFDDWNLEDSCIDFCIDNAEKASHADYISEGGRLKCLEALRAMKELSIDERHSAMAIDFGII